MLAKLSRSRIRRRKRTGAVAMLNQPPQFLFAPSRSPALCRVPKSPPRSCRRCRKLEFAVAISGEPSQAEERCRDLRRAAAKARALSQSPGRCRDVELAVAMSGKLSRSLLRGRIVLGAVALFRGPSRSWSESRTMTCLRGRSGSIGPISAKGRRSRPAPVALSGLTMLSLAGHPGLTPRAIQMPPPAGANLRRRDSSCPRPSWWNARDASPS